MDQDFLDFLQNTEQEIFIEAEATEDKMLKFIREYNKNYSPQLDFDTDGICLLGDVDKWGVQLRIYFNDINNIPNYWEDRKYKIRHFRSEEYLYRLDDSQLVKYLFNNGYRIGRND